MDGILGLLASLPLYILVISIVITVHELGHYWAGRMFGAAIESFSFGFGRSLVERRDRRGTRWRLNWAPIGGFVKFVGEVQVPSDVNEPQPETVATEEQAAAIAQSRHPEMAEKARDVTFYDDQVLVGRPYTSLGPWKRIAISLGGPVANFVFAIFAFAVIGAATGVPTAKEVVVEKVEAGTPSETAGFKVGDVVLEAGGRPISIASDLRMVTSLNSGDDVTFKVRRGPELLTLVARPIETTIVNELTKAKQKVGIIGVTPGERDTAVKRLNPAEAMGYGVIRTGDTIGLTVNVLRRLLTGKEGIDKLSGPVGILHLTSGISEMTLKQEGVPLGERIAQLAWTLFQLAALLSVGVGFFNLLPIPILDGGAIVMFLAEAVTGKPLPDKVQSAGLTIGLVCLVLFGVVITGQDILRLPFQFLGGS